MTEEQQMVSTASMAVSAGLITKRMALEKLRPVFPFENIEAIVEQIEKETPATPAVSAKPAAKAEASSRAETMPPPEEESETESETE